MAMVRGSLTFEYHPHLYCVNEKTAPKSLPLTPWTNYSTLFKSDVPKTQSRDVLEREFFLNESKSTMIIMSLNLVQSSSFKIH